MYTFYKYGGGTKRYTQIIFKPKRPNPRRRMRRHHPDSSSVKDLLPQLLTVLLGHSTVLGWAQSPLATTQLPSGLLQKQSVALPKVTLFQGGSYPINDGMDKLWELKSSKANLGQHEEPL